METYSPFPTMEQSSLHSSALANSDGLAARSQRKREAEAYVQDFPRDNLAFDSDDIEVPCSPHATQPTQPTQIIRPSDKARPWRTCGSQPTLLADVHMTNSKETQPTQIVAQSCKAWLGTQPTEFLGTDCRQSQLFESLCLPSPSDTANPFFLTNRRPSFHGLVLTEPSPLSLHTDKNNLHSLWKRCTILIRPLTFLTRRQMLTVR